MYDYQKISRFNNYLIMVPYLEPCKYGYYHFGVSNQKLEFLI